MEITSFYPMIPTKDFEATKATYEALGFKVAHTISNPDDKLKDKRMFTIMKNDNGLRVALYAGPEYNEDTDFNTLPGQIWMNVRDFDATVALFKEHGYTNTTEVSEYKFMKVISMRAPEGIIITVVYHKREHDED